ncbi:MAG: 3-phosphoshikimate 1-carboxyvinyltransferase [Actinomycetota bacterium]|nr:3-phosphoshikimate 1-carboxyvinyltransferase [Actinomycetota bacterium]
MSSSPLRPRTTEVGPSGPLRGTAGVPGDKSISHRALILGALAGGRSRLTGVNLGRDVGATAEGLARLGAGVEWHRDEARVDVDGWGARGPREPQDVLDAGNSGTTLRCLLGVCAGAAGAFVFTGDESLRERPMGRVVAPLRAMGAHIDGRADATRAPLIVRGGDLIGVPHTLPVASAQVKTALLLAGLEATGPTSVTEPRASRDHTERMLAASGVRVDRGPLTATVTGAGKVAPGPRRVPGDLSSAAFILAGALVVPGSDVVVSDVGVNPTRAGILRVLSAMGADLEVEHVGEWGGEPVGTVRARASVLRGVTVDEAEVPALIDELPVLAVVATKATGRTLIRGAGELRVKESDRIATMAAGLSAMGAEVEALPDGLVIDGPTTLRPAAVDSAGDHRVAMSLAVAGMTAVGRVTIRGWDCVDTSFPGFLPTFGALQSRTGMGARP